MKKLPPPLVIPLPNGDEKKNITVALKDTGLREAQFKSRQRVGWPNSDHRKLTEYRETHSDARGRQFPQRFYLRSELKEFMEREDVAATKPKSKRSQPTIFTTETVEGTVGNVEAVIAECKKISTERESNGETVKHLTASMFNYHQRNGWTPSEKKLGSILCKGPNAPGKCWTYKCYSLDAAILLWTAYLEWLADYEKNALLVDAYASGDPKRKKRRKKDLLKPRKKHRHILHIRSLPGKNNGKDDHHVNRAWMVRQYNMHYLTVGGRISELKPHKLDEGIKTPYFTLNQDFWWESEVDALLRHSTIPNHKAFKDAKGVNRLMKIGVAKRLGCCFNTVNLLIEQGQLSCKEVPGPNSRKPVQGVPLAEVEEVERRRNDGKKTIDGKPHISTEKTAERLGVSTNTLTGRWQNKHGLKHVKVGNFIWWEEATVNRLERRIDAAQNDPRVAWPYRRQIAKQVDLPLSLVNLILGEAQKTGEVAVFAPGVPIQRGKNKFAPAAVLFEAAASKRAIAAVLLEFCESLEQAGNSPHTLSQLAKLFPFALTVAKNRPLTGILAQGRESGQLAHEDRRVHFGDNRYAGYVYRPTDVAAYVRARCQFNLVLNDPGASTQEQPPSEPLPSLDDEDRDILKAAHDIYNRGEKPTAEGIAEITDDDRSNGSFNRHIRRLMNDGFFHTNGKKGRGSSGYLLTELAKKTLKN